jgi:hypothetical protein
MYMKSVSLDVSRAFCVVELNTVLSGRSLCFSAKIVASNPLDYLALRSKIAFFGNSGSISSRSLSFTTPKTICSCSNFFLI